MYTKIKSLQLNKAMILPGLLFLCVIILIVLLSIFFAGEKSDDDFEPSTLQTQGEANEQKLNNLNGGSEESPVSTPETGVEGVEETNAGTDLMNMAGDSSEALAFSPAELQRIRDPFQSLLRKNIPISSGTSETATVVALEPEVKSPVKTSSGSTKSTSHNISNNSTKTDQNTNEPKKTDSPSESSKKVIDYPPFVLKGIVSSDGVRKAIMVTNHQSYIVVKGEKVQEWFIENVLEKEVRLTNGEGQRFIVTLEGVVLDESKN